MREASNAAIDAATTVLATRETADAPAGAAGDRGFTAPLDSSIMDRLEVLLTPTLNVSDLAHRYPFCYSRFIG